MGACAITDSETRRITGIAVLPGSLAIVVPFKRFSAESKRLS